MPGCLDPDPSIALELVGSALTARVNLSTTPGNALQVLPDGVYAQGGFACALRRSVSAQSYTGPQAALAVSWDTEDFDSAAMWDPALPTRITLPVTGMYVVSTYLNVAVGTVVAGAHGAKIRANGSTDLNVPTPFAGNTPYTPLTNRGLWTDSATTMQLLTTLQLPVFVAGKFRATAGEYIEAILETATTGASNVHGLPATTGGASSIFCAFLGA